MDRENRVVLVLVSYTKSIFLLLYVILELHGQNILFRAFRIGGSQKFT